MTILVTGAAGFIGFHLCKQLLASGAEVVGLDNLNAYYDTSLKQARLVALQHHKLFHFIEADITDNAALAALKSTYPDIDTVIHLAAQAGVRHSLHAPFDYSHSNLHGTLSMLEFCRHLPTLRHLVMASSSSVYGNSAKAPFSIQDTAVQPVSLYAATKRAGELMAYSYSDLYQLPITALRFFTVYGAYGRPDMAYYGFTQAIDAGHPITLYHEGSLRRDFTYIDDIVAGIVAVSAKPPQGTPPYAVYNLGNSAPVTVKKLVEVIESALGKRAIIEYAAMQAGDVYETSADITESTRDFGFSPRTSLEQGIPEFVKWYKDYHPNCRDKKWQKLHM